MRKVTQTETSAPETFLFPQLPSYALEELIGDHTGGATDHALAKGGTYSDWGDPIAFLCASVSLW
jgi:hypothetical protein